MIQWNNDNNGLGTGEITDLETGESISVQSDWDFPGVASSFGWSIQSAQREGMKCEHSNTDGTVTCKSCGLTATDFISAAQEWLHENEGATAEDPGYFS